MAVTETKMSEEERRRAWRLLMLLDTVRDLRSNGPIDLEEVSLLGKVAKGDHDLHRACDALMGGCTIGLLADIFT